MKIELTVFMKSGAVHRTITENYKSVDELMNYLSLTILKSEPWTHLVKSSIVVKSSEIEGYKATEVVPMLPDINL